MARRKQAQAEVHPDVYGPTSAQREAALDDLLGKANEPPPAEDSTS
jgi:hypothetical protein